VLCSAPGNPFRRRNTGVWESRPGARPEVPSDIALIGAWACPKKALLHKRWRGACLPR